MKVMQDTSDIFSALGISAQDNIRIQDFQIDSRKVRKNSVFFGLSGSNEDGSIYGQEAIAKGASLAIIKSTKPSLKNKLKSNILSVPKPEESLIALAKSALKKFPGPIVGITGSNGKTTTKNILHAGINNSFATFNNFNNEIGLPLCALSLDTKNTVAIFEMGAAKKGDINFLSRLIKPDIGIITHIGHSHLEGLRSLDGVLKVKSELIDNINKNGIAILPEGPHIKYWKGLRKDITFRTFGLNDAASFFATHIKSTKAGTAFTINSPCLRKKIKIQTCLLGNHNILNILAGFIATLELKQDIDFFVDSLKAFSNTSQRLQLQPWINKSTVIDDSYNANPDSVKAAIDVLHEQTGRCILVLGDMKELGRYRKKLHQNIGAYAKTKKINLLIGFGDLARHAASSFGPSGMFFSSKTELLSFLKGEVTRGDCILIKGSRSMKMETLINTGERA